MSSRSRAAAITGRSFLPRSGQDGDNNTNYNSSSRSHAVVIRRTPEEKARSPDKLILDSRGLEWCPLLEDEKALRLLNLKNNAIACLGNLGDLPSLIFLDLYGNKLETLDGPLSSLSNLRVLMVGRNRINSLLHLAPAAMLDVLDLHANNIGSLHGIGAARRLRVLNLAGNTITDIMPLCTITSLTELNLRRNRIAHIPEDLSSLVHLSKLFLSSNLLSSCESVIAVLALPLLTDLAVDDNPLTLSQPAGLVKTWILGSAQSIRVFNDKDAVSEEERGAALGECRAALLQLTAPPLPTIPTAAALVDVTVTSEQGLHQLGITHTPASASASVNSLTIADLSSDSILHILASYSPLPSVTTLSLVSNNILTFSELKLLLALFPSISELTISDSPVCSSPMLRAFVCTLLPRLAAFKNLSLPISESVVSASRGRGGGGAGDASSFDQVFEAAVWDVVDVCLRSAASRN